MNEIQTQVWLDDLIGCPSQCYYYFENPLDKKKYCIYLRWRHLDPWTAELIPCDEYYDLDFEATWEEIPIDFFTEDKLDKAKKMAIKIVNSRLPLNFQLKG